MAGGTCRTPLAGAGTCRSAQASARQDPIARLALSRCPSPRLNPTNRLLLTCPCLQNVLESPCFGVPGLCTYNAARAVWIRQQVQAAVEGDSCRQVVVLRAGWSTWSHSLAQPGVQVRTARHASAAIQSVPICPSTVALLPAGREVAVGGRAAIVTADPASIVPPNRCSDVPCALFVTSPPFQFYEVDSRQAVQRKKEALDALLPSWRRAARRPRFVEGERARAVWQAVEGLVEALHTLLLLLGLDISHWLRS